MHQDIRVGVGVMVFNDGKILLGKRKGAHGESEYGFPGGHLEYLESFNDCAKRETKEECGIEIDNIEFSFLLNLKEYAPKHYVHIGLNAKWKSGELKLLEPHKCESWGWYSLEDLPTPLFRPCAYAIENHKSGKNYFDF